MKKLEEVLASWPKSIIRDSDLANELATTDNARYSSVKRALKNKTLLRLRKGLYLITEKTRGQLTNELALSLYLYEPSFVSLESALSFYGWIPEAVYTTTSVSPRRAKEFSTAFGLFTYKRVPEEAFYLGVERIESSIGISLIAQPWRALADYVYVYSKKWNSLTALQEDLRIAFDTTTSSRHQLLKNLVRYYPSLRVRKQLKIFLDELTTKNFK